MVRGTLLFHGAVALLAAIEIANVCAPEPAARAVTASLPHALPAPSPPPRAETIPAPAVDPRGRAYELHVRGAIDPGHGMPNAWVYVPRAFDPTRRRLHVFVVFHGWQNCIKSYVSPHGEVCSQRHHTGYDVAAQIEQSGTHAIVVVPQLAYEVKSSDPGKLGAPGGLRALLEELVEESLVPVLGAHDYEDIERVALVASSGGWQALTPALVQGGVEAVHDVYLLDALYEDEPLTSFFLSRAKEFDPRRPSPWRFTLVYCWYISGSARVDERFGAAMKGALDAEGLGDLARVRSEWREPNEDELRAPFAVVSTGMNHDAMVLAYLWRVLRAAEM
jgi:hypothetical protein